MCVFVCLFVCLFVHLFVRLFVCFVCLFVWGGLAISGSRPRAEQMNTGVGQRGKRRGTAKNLTGVGKGDVTHIRMLLLRRCCPMVYIFTRCDQNKNEELPYRLQMSVFSGGVELASGLALHIYFVSLYVCCGCCCCCCGAVVQRLAFFSEYKIEYQRQNVILKAKCNFNHEM